MRIGRIMAVAGALIIGSASSAAAQPAAAPKPDDTVNNPPFAHWSAFKPGTTVTQKQVVSLSDGRKVEHVITTKLLQKSKERVVVETTVKDNAKGMVESTRTVTSYPAKVKAGQVHTPPTADVSVTEGKEEVTVKGQKAAAEWVEAVTRNGDEVWTEKMWTARDIPGGIIKQALVHKRGDKVVSESVLEVVAFKHGS